MKPRILPLVVLLALCPLLSARAGVVLSNITEAWEDGRTFTSMQGTFSGLAFKTGSSAGKIDALSFSLVAGASPSNFPTITFSVFLYQLDGSHLPTGSALATDTGLSATFTGDLPFLQNTFSYASDDLTAINAVQLAANTEYAIVLGNNDGNDEYYWGAKYDPPGYVLSDGYTWIGNVNSSDSGASWSGTTNVGYIAEISVTNVPEPMVAPLFVTGGLALLLWRKRRFRQ